MRARNDDILISSSSRRKTARIVWGQEKNPLEKKHSRILAARMCLHRGDIIFCVRRHRNSIKGGDE
jgi:hypothetical protein